MPGAWLPVGAAIVISSALALAVAGRVAQALLNRSPRTLPQARDGHGVR